MFLFAHFHTAPQAFKGLFFKIKKRQLNIVLKYKTQGQLRFDFDEIVLGRYANQSCLTDSIIPGR